MPAKSVQSWNASGEHTTGFSTNDLLQWKFLESPRLTIIINAIFTERIGVFVTGWVFSCYSCRPGMDLFSLNEESFPIASRRLVMIPPTVSLFTFGSLSIICWKYSWSYSHLSFIYINAHLKYDDCLSHRIRPPLASSNSVLKALANSLLSWVSLSASKSWQQLLTSVLPNVCNISGVK